MHRLSAGRAGVPVGKRPRLFSVRATSAAGVWVTGNAKFPGRADYNDFVSHRSGDHWVNHDLGAGAELSDVRILGHDDVWVLFARNRGGTQVGFGDHWNGQGWTRVRLPAVPTYGDGSGHWASAHANGSPTALRLLRYNSTGWTVYSGPRLTRSPRSAYYSGVLVRGDSLFVLVAYDLGEGGTSGTTLFERDAKGSWHRRLDLPTTFNEGLTRTSAPGLWLVTSTSGYGGLTHVVGGKVVSNAVPPKTDGRPTEPDAVSGTAHSPTLFVAAEVSIDSSIGAAAATYRP